METKTKYSFITPWKPDEHSFVEALRTASSDKRKSALERDLRATARLCELLELCSFSDAQGFREGMAENATLPYDVVHWYDFASVSLSGLNNLHRRLFAELHQESFPYVDRHIQVISVESDIWTNEMLSERQDRSCGNVWFGLKTAEGEPERASLFGLCNKTTTSVDVRQSNDICGAFNSLHSGFETMTLSVRAPRIWSLMDLVDELDGVSGEVNRRAPKGCYYRDLPLKQCTGNAGCFGLRDDGTSFFCEERQIPKRRDMSVGFSVGGVKVSD
jgi:hypothetical protein